MKKTLALVFAASLVVSAVELLYVHSSPLLGEGDVSQMTYPGGGMASSFEDTNFAYKKLYERRVHRADPYAGFYRLAVLTPFIADTMGFGVLEWQMGLFNECRRGEVNESLEATLERWSRHRPAAVDSQFIPLENYTTAIVGPDVSELKKYWGGRRGKSLAMFSLSWLMLGDFTGNSQFLFEEQCGQINNMTGRMLLESIAGAYRVYFARTMFVESVFDGEPHWKGIFYMAYYPGYNKTWVVVYGIPEDEVSKARVTLDGVERQTEVIHPFIIVDGHIPDGGHSMVLSAGKEDYAIAFSLASSPLVIQGAATGVKSNGRFVTVLSNLNSTIQLNYVKGVLDGQASETALDTTMPPYNTSMVEVNFTKKLENGRYYDLELMVSYTMDGGQAWLNKTLRLPAE